MRAKCFWGVFFNISRIYGKYLEPVKCFKLTGGFGCFSVYGGSDDDLLYVGPLYCLYEFCVWSLFCYAVLSVLSSFAIFLIRK